MRTIVPLLVVGTLFPVVATAQIDTTGGRYFDALFPEVAITTDVIYGENDGYLGTPVTLKLDVYEPQGDVLPMRPLIVLAHGGAFLSGTRSDEDVVEFCTRFARMGYVCASIDYRLGANGIDVTNVYLAVLRAVQDMKAAVRFFRADAAGANAYRIHPAYVFIGGSSAGGITAVHAAYWDAAAEFLPGSAVLAANGGFEGDSGNPEFPSSSNAVVSLCGGIGQSTWLGAGDVPIVMVHGTADATVPFGAGYITYMSIPIIQMEGSELVAQRAADQGVPYALYPFQDADHIPYLGSTPDAVAYMDTTALFVKTFLRPLLAEAPSGIDPSAAVSVSVFPNPTADELFIRVPATCAADQFALYDLAGQMLVNGSVKPGTILVNLLGLAPGVYVLHVMGRGVTWTDRIILQR